MAQCTDSFSRGFNNVVRRLFQPLRLFTWLKLLLIVFFLKGFSILNMGKLLQGMPSVENFDQWAEKALDTLPVIMGVLVASMIFGVVVSFLKSCARFVFYDVVRENSMRCASSLRVHFSGIISHFVWKIGMMIVFSIVALIGLLLLTIPNWLFESLGNETLGMILSLTTDLLFALFWLLVIVVHTLLLDSAVVPQMVVEHKGLLESWRHTLRLVLDNLGEWIGFAVIQIMLSLALTCLYFLIVMIFGMLFSGMQMAGILSSGVVETHWINFSHLPLQFGILFFLLPFPVLQSSYALSFMAAQCRNGSYEPEPDNLESCKESDQEKYTPDSTMKPMESLSSAILFRDIPHDGSAPATGNHSSLSPQPPDSEEGKDSLE